MNNEQNKDFNTVFNIYQNDFSHSDLIELLKMGNVAQKQAAALKLNSIKTNTEAEILISNLTGCDGKIREAVSFKLKEFIPQNPELYIKFADIFLDAIIDINGNICRNTINAIKKLFYFEEFVQKFVPKLLKNTLELSKIAKNFDIQDGKYKINKEIFKLYWYLEAISQFAEFINSEQIEKIISITSEVGEYTIREKSAKILSKINLSKEMLILKEKLQNDKNYYVKRV